MSKKLYLAALITSLFCLLPTLTPVRAGDNNASANTEQTLSQLEDRFFEHQYDHDTDSDRLDRLEKFIFGSTENGSVESRLNHIEAAVPPVTDQSTTNTDNYSSDNQSADHTANQQSAPDQTANNDQTDSQSDAGSEGPFDYSSYPRVTSLEQELLGQTYTNDSLPQRLARMEAKAFGKSSTSDDLSQRVDALDAYAGRHDLYGTRTPTNNIANNYNYTSANSSANSSRQAIPSSEASRPNTNFVGSVEERVAMMEAQEFDHTYPDRPLDKRLKKLEKHILPNQDNTNLGLAERTNRLWLAIHPGDKNLVASSVSGNNNNASLGATSNVDDQSKTKPHHSWLHSLANGVGSLAAGGMMNPAYGYSNYSNSSSAYGPPLAPGVPYNLAAPAGSRFIGGATFGPGAGPFGVPFSVW